MTTQDENRSNTSNGAITELKKLLKEYVLGLALMIVSCLLSFVNVFLLQFAISVISVLTFYSDWEPDIAQLNTFVTIFMACLLYYIIRGVFKFGGSLLQIIVSTFVILPFGRMWMSPYSWGYLAAAPASGLSLFFLCVFICPLLLILTKKVSDPFLLTRNFKQRERRAVRRSREIHQEKNNCFLVFRKLMRFK